MIAIFENGFDLMTQNFPSDGRVKILHGQNSSDRTFKEPKDLWKSLAQFTRAAVVMAGTIYVWQQWHGVNHQIVFETLDEHIAMEERLGFLK